MIEKTRIIQGVSTGKKVSADKKTFKTLGPKNYRVKTPCISVLMSVYNGERWLEECIKSVLNQTFTNFEFVIINDGSTDSSLNIIRSLKAQDQRIRVITKENTGLTDSLNVGIENASGDWIARIDSDDLCESSRLAEQYTLTRKNPNLVLVGSGALEINHEGAFLKKHVYPTNHRDLVRRLISISKGFFPHSSAFMRAKTVRNLNGYRKSFKRAQDYDLWLRMSRHGEISCHKSPLVQIRRHTGQVTNEDKGKRQKTDSRAALVSFLLCQRGKPDPLAGRDSDKQLGDFWEFIRQGCEKNKLVQFRAFQSQVRALWMSPGLRNKLAAIKVATSSPYFVLRYFKEFLLGESLAGNLCKDWINQNQK